MDHQYEEFSISGQQLNILQVQPQMTNQIQHSEFLEDTFRRLIDIYEKNEGESNTGLNSIFSLFTYVENPLNFEHSIWEEKWVATMDEKIDVI